MTDILRVPELAALATLNPVVDAPGETALGPQATRLLVQIMTQPRSHTGPVGRLRRPRRSLAVLLTSFGILGVGGVAVASGVVPDGVTHAFLRSSPAGDQVSDAHVVAEVAAAPGIREQIWVGHNSSGGFCEYTRTVTSGGHEDGGVGYFSSGTQPDGATSAPPPPAFGVGYEPAGRPLPSLTYIVTVHTSIAAISSAAMVFPDGHSIPLAFNRATGYAIGIVPPSQSDHPGRVRGYDDAGKIVADQSPPGSG